jgi:hypothetical protein
MRRKRWYGRGKRGVRDEPNRIVDRFLDEGLLNTSLMAFHPASELKR